jgi:hypothetical protein
VYQRHGQSRLIWGEGWDRGLTWLRQGAMQGRRVSGPGASALVSDNDRNAILLRALCNVNKFANAACAKTHLCEHLTSV